MNSDNAEIIFAIIFVSGVVYLMGSFLPLMMEFPASCSITERLTFLYPSSYPSSISKSIRLIIYPLFLSTHASPSSLNAPISLIIISVALP